MGGVLAGEHTAGQQDRQAKEQRANHHEEGYRLLVDGRDDASAPEPDSSYLGLAAHDADQIAV